MFKFTSGSKSPFARRKAARLMAMRSMLCRKE